MADQHSARRVKLSALIEGLDFQSDESFSYLNTTTGRWSLSRRRSCERLRRMPLSKTSRIGSMTPFAWLRTLSKRITISHCLTDLRSMNTRSWSGSVSRSMMRTCVMICVTPYVVEGHFRRFKDRMQVYGMAEEWYRYRDAALREIAVRGVRPMAFRTRIKRPAYYCVFPLDRQAMRVWYPTPAASTSDDDPRLHDTA